jgi:hypothetical protein
MGFDKSLPGFDDGIVLDAEFLQDEEGAHTHEGVRRELRGDDWLDVAIMRVEDAEEIRHLTRLRDEVADIAKLIGEALEFGAVVVHRGRLAAWNAVHP